MRDTWGAPSNGWPAFFPDGKVQHPCPFCPDFVGETDGALADHIRECEGMK